MNMTGKCQACGSPLIGTVRQHRPGGPWQEGWRHANQADADINGLHSAHPLDGTVGPWMAPDFVMYPEVTVTLVGQDGNALNLIAIVESALRRQVGKAQARRFAELAIESESYDHLLEFIQHTVNVR